MLGSILWAVVVLLVILWLVGFLVVHVGGGLIHLLLIVALIVLLYNLFVAGRARVQASSFRPLKVDEQCSFECGDIYLLTAAGRALFLYVEELTQIRDELGAMHDSDVIIGLLRLRLGSQESVPIYDQVLSAAQKQPGKARSILRPELVAVLIDAKVAPSAEDRYGLEQLLRKYQQNREQQYAAFRQHWYQLQVRDFRSELLGILDA